MALTKDVKADLVKKFGKDEKDTGSIEVQIAILTEEINTLTAHFKNTNMIITQKEDYFIK